MTKAASFSSLTAVFDFWMAKSAEKYDQRDLELLFKGYRLQKPSRHEFKGSAEPINFEKRVLEPIIF